MPQAEHVQIPIRDLRPLLDGIEPGTWVVVDEAEGRVVARGPSLRAAREAAERCGFGPPFHVHRVQDPADYFYL